MEAKETPRIKDIWFDYVVKHRKLWCNGFTESRLQRVREYVLDDKHILDDLFVRHGAAGMFPDELKQENKFAFEHGLSNFTAAILDKMIEHGIYKIK